MRCVSLFHQPGRPGFEEDRKPRQPQHRGRHPPTTAGSEPGARRGNKGPTLITRLGPTPLPSREPEPHCSVTFPWLGLTPQRSTRGATRDRDSNTQLNARDNHRASRARLTTTRDRSRRGRRPLSLRDIDNRIPREKNRRGWSEAEASEVLRPPALEASDGRSAPLASTSSMAAQRPLLTSRPLRPPGRSRLRLSLSP